MSALNRRTGKTTRLIDEAIQYLFKNQTLYLFTDIGLSTSTPSVPKEERVFIDPDYRRGNGAQRDFIHRVLQRLKIEHSRSVTVEKKQYFIIISVND